MEADYPRLERLPVVLARTGISKSMAYREAAAGRFPKPVKIGSTSVWVSREIDRWIDDLCAQRAGVGEIH